MKILELSLYCYLGNVFAKRDWLIYDQVASDKCNISPWAASKKLLPAANKTNFT